MSLDTHAGGSISRLSLISSHTNGHCKHSGMMYNWLPKYTKCQTNREKGTIQFRATIIWNEIPYSLRNTPVSNIFKSGHFNEF